MNRIKWRDIRPTLDSAAEKRIKQEKEEILLEMNLRGILMHISDLTKTEIGKLLRVSQAALSHLGWRSTSL